MMRTPRKGSLAFDICQAFVDHGSMTMPQIVSRFSHRQTKTIYSAVNQQRYYNILELVDGVYRLTKPARVHYGLDEPEPEQPIAQCYETKPINPKYIPSREVSRPGAEPLRDISFKTGSVGFPVGYRI